MFKISLIINIIALLLLIDMWNPYRSTLYEEILEELEEELYD